MSINNILLVDDETKVTETIGRFLKMKGFTVFQASNGVEALAVARKQALDVVLTDVRMPQMDGIECLKQLKATYPDIEVIMATAMGEAETAIECMKSGAFGYLMKPLDLNAIYTEILKALEHRALLQKINDYQHNLEQKVEERTNEIVVLNQQLRGSFLTSIRMLISLLEAYDPFIAGHLRRVASLSRLIGRLINVPQKDQPPIEIAALLHDIGTVALPKRLRTAEFSKLSNDEILVIKQHTVIAQNIMSSFEKLETAGLIVRSHLERLDGTGFPDGLKDESIPLGSKILGVANAYDELTSRRRFSGEQFGDEEEKESFALKQLAKVSGKHYERQIIEALKEAIVENRMKSRNETVAEVKNIKAGMVLAEDLFTKEGLLLLSKGHTILPAQVKQINYFHNMGMIPPQLRVQL